MTEESPPVAGLRLDDLARVENAGDAVGRSMLPTARVRPGSGARDVSRPRWRLRVPIRRPPFLRLSRAGLQPLPFLGFDACETGRLESFEV